MGNLVRCLSSNNPMFPNGIFSKDGTSFSNRASGRSVKSAADLSTNPSAIWEFFMPERLLKPLMSLAIATPLDVPVVLTARFSAMSNLSSNFLTLPSKLQACFVQSTNTLRRIGLFSGSRGDSFMIAANQIVNVIMSEHIALTGPITTRVEST